MKVELFIDPFKYKENYFRAVFTFLPRKNIFIGDEYDYQYFGFFLLWPLIDYFRQLDQAVPVTSGLYVAVE